MTQLQGRIAAPFTCLAVVLIALPFGARSGRHNVFVGVAGSIFICFAYFILQRVSFGLGVAGYLPPLAGGMAAQHPFRRRRYRPHVPSALKSCLPIHLLEH